MLTTTVSSVYPLREESFNLGRTTVIPQSSSLHSSVGVEGGVRSDVSTRAKPSSMVVVLDLDECLVHSRAAMAGEGVSEHSFVFETDDHQPQLVHVTLRPYLQEFLREVTSRYETCVFTAGQERYASPLLDILDPTGTMFSHRFFPKDLSYHGGLKCNVKDLRAAFSQKGVTFDPRRVVLVDNSRINFALNPSNGIPIVDFVGDRNDSELKDLVHVLRELEEFRDVRPVLDNVYHLETEFVQYHVLHEREEEEGVDVGSVDDVEVVVEEEEEEKDNDEVSEIIFDDMGDVIMRDAEVESAKDGEDVVVEEDDDVDSLLGLDILNQDNDLDSLDCSECSSIDDVDLEDDLDFWISFQYPWEVEEDFSLDQDSDSVEVEEEVEQEEEVEEEVEQVLRRSPRLRNVPRVDYRKYF